MVILGISIGTRTSGLAIINQKGLVEWRTLSFKNSWSEQKADYIVRKYERHVRRHKVTVVSIKIPPLSHQSQPIASILEKLCAMFTYHGCMVQYHTKAQLKKSISGVKNTKQLMECSASLYPELARNHQRQLQCRNKYHDKMFEAVLVAHLCKQESSYPPN